MVAEAATSGEHGLKRVLGPFNLVTLGIGAIIGTLITFLILYAYGELISLLISLEENTRLTAERLAGLPATTTTSTTLSTEKS